MHKRQTKRRPMMVIGLTGSIGMGKSTAAKILGAMGFPIYSADRAVHEVLKKGGKAVPAVAKLFPETLKKGGIDRKCLGRAVFGKPRKLRQLEKIVHPLLKQAERLFLQKARQNKHPAAILEIPLLFETGGEKRCDITLCVTAPRKIQRMRVLSRKDMTEDKLRAILARQMPDAEKRTRADFIVPTGKGLHTTKQHLHDILRKLLLLP
jgi:dephospho-CoA kinase